MTSRSDFEYQYEVILRGVSTENAEFFDRRYLVYAREGPHEALSKAISRVCFEHSELYKDKTWIFCSAKVIKAEELRVI